MPSSGSIEFRINAPYIDGNRDSEVTVTYAIGGITSLSLAFFIGTKDPLYIDSSEMILEVGETANRTATGGRPRYDYEADSDDVVLAASNGNVHAILVGNAVVTVSDSSTPPQRKSYPVRVIKRREVEDFETAPIGGIGRPFERPQMTFSMYPSDARHTSIVESTRGDYLGGRVLRMTRHSNTVSTELGVTFKAKAKRVRFSAYSDANSEYTASDGSFPPTYPRHYITPNVPGEYIAEHNGKDISVYFHIVGPIGSILEIDNIEVLD
ncbi:hypothetical protein [Luteibacter aegosomatissinici]|uniref:hypothetical protein n=1 Tax=Luteibacter aegosomatissinici TaxID=2911539 RepID=UPI001FF77B7F|nr:hypothetical protein [Luteibacter aegosomatissinici]UPG96432.1 hypothetical protein L2Y97_10065 [Luteibacter aegosomatissinici]